MNSKDGDSLQDLLLAYLDGALDAAAKDRVRATINADPAIAAEFTALRDLWNGLEGLGDDRRTAIQPIDITAAVRAAAAATPPDLPIPDDFLDRGAFAEAAMDYWDGALAPAAREAFERSLAVSPVHRDEYAVLASIKDDLEAMGRTAARGAPAIDVSQAVRAAVSGREIEPAPASNVTPFRPLRAVRWLAAAAAVVAIGAFLWRSSEPPIDDNRVQTAVTPPAAPESPEAPAGPQPGAPAVANDGDMRLAQAKEQLKAALDNLPVGEALRPAAEGAVFAETAAPNLAQMTVEGVLALRRAAITASNEERSQRRAEFARMAALDGDTATAIAYDPAMPALARLGAAGMLPPGEGLAAAQLAAAEMPDSLYAQFAAAEAALLQEQAEPGSVPLEAILEPLRRLQALDPANATPYMMEAAALFQAGDIQGALAALEAAGGLTSADAYSGEAAMAAGAALEAAGMPADAAMTAAALNAGYPEYASLFDLGLDLLEIGSSFAAAGDADTADAIFGSVNGFAGALYQAPYTFEQLAGLDLQRQALGLVEQFSAAVQQEVAAVEQLTADALAVLAGMTNVRSVLDVVDGLLMAPLGEAETAAIVDTLLTQGDTALAGQ